MKPSKLTYRQQFYALLGLLLLLCLFAYKRSFGPTLSTVNGYYSAKEKIENQETLNQELSIALSQNQQLDGLIGKNTTDPILVQNAIMEFVAGRPYQIKVTSFDPMHKVTDPYFTVYTNSVTLQGGINDLLKTMHDLETQFELSRIAHVNIYIKKNYKTRKNELFSQLLFRQYEKN